MKIILTETQLNKLISDQEYENMGSRPISFTEEDREMLERIYDVVVRAIPALGTLPDTKSY